MRISIALVLALAWASGSCGTINDPPRECIFGQETTLLGRFEITGLTPSDLEDYMEDVASRNGMAFSQTRRQPSLGSKSLHLCSSDSYVVVSKMNEFDPTIVYVSAASGRGSERTLSLVREIGGVFREAGITTEFIRNN